MTVILTFMLNILYVGIRLAVVLSNVAQDIVLATLTFFGHAFFDAVTFKKTFFDKHRKLISCLINT